MSHPRKTKQHPLMIRPGTAEKLRQIKLKTRVPFVDQVDLWADREIEKLGIQTMKTSTRRPLRERVNGVSTTPLPSAAQATAGALATTGEHRPNS